MDLSRAVYSRDLKVAAMRALEAGATNGEEEPGDRPPVSTHSLGAKSNAP